MVVTVYGGCRVRVWCFGYRVVSSWLENVTPSGVGLLCREWVSSVLLGGLCWWSLLGYEMAFDC